MSTPIYHNIFLQSGLFDVESLFNIYSLIIIGLLVVLLVQKELVRAYWGERAKIWLWALNIVIVPFLLAFGLIMTVRLWQLIQVSDLF